jgi:hypothetical protein
MPLVADMPAVLLPEPTRIYGTYVGRELTDNDLYTKSNAKLRERSRNSEFLRIVDQQRQQELQIQSLQELRFNWNSYNAEPPNATAFARTHQVLATARKQRIEVTRIVPSAEGGIGVCFVAGNRYAHIEASNDGELTFVMFSGNDPAQMGEIQDEQALVEALNRIRQHTNI